MKYSNFIAILTVMLNIILQTSCEKTENDDVEEIFQPTNKWQEVKKGYSIPRGLHVRMNLEKGTVEAKLMEEDGTNSKTDIVHIPNENEEMEESIIEADFKQKLYSAKRLEEALKSIEPDDFKIDSPTKSNDFRSFQEVKSDFEALNMTIKTGIEILRDLIRKYHSSHDDDQLRVTILNNLEFLVHQYDNAQDFVQMNGISEIVMPALNSTSNEIRSEAAFLLGSAMQSNPRVQIASLENGALQQLLRLISLDSDANVRTKAMYALSCLVRNYPLAQKKLIENGGLPLFSKLFTTSDSQTSKLQIKIITFLNDLVLENQFASMETTNIPAWKRRQYKGIELERTLAEQGWCSLISNLLNLTVVNQYRQDLSAPMSPKLVLSLEHDTVEKVITAMLTMVNSCQRQFRQVLSILRELEITYSDLSVNEVSEEGDENFYTTLLNLLKRLINEINIKDEL